MPSIRTVTLETEYFISPTIPIVDGKPLKDRAVLITLIPSPSVHSSQGIIMVIVDSVTYLGSGPLSELFWQQELTFL